MKLIFTQSEQFQSFVLRVFYSGMYFYSKQKRSRNSLNNCDCRSSQAKSLIETDFSFYHFISLFHWTPLHFTIQIIFLRDHTCERRESIEPTVYMQREKKKGTE